MRTSPAPLSHSEVRILIRAIALHKCPDQTRRYAPLMPERIMYVQLKTGHALDAGPAWISRVRFTKTWKTAYFHGRTLAREQSWDANFRDLDTDEWFWLSGPKRDRSDTRYGHGAPTIDDDARADYEAFLDGAPLPGREHG